MVTKPFFTTSSPPTPGDLNVPPDVQRLWFTLAQKSWSFLVVMPAHPGGNVVKLTEALAQVGTRHRGTPVRFLNALNVDVGGTSHVIVEAVSQNPAESAALVAVDCPLQNPAAIPLALAADGVVLVVELGVTEVESARQTVEAVGRERILGTVTVGPGALP